MEGTPKSSGLQSSLDGRHAVSAPPVVASEVAWVCGSAVVDGLDLGHLDMHQLGGGMIYCISILENFSRAILASAISRQQDTEAYLAVLYAAIRRHGVPEVLVSDNGGVFRSHDAMRIYEALGIQKHEIEKRQAWQSYIESNFNAQRRLADWHFERAQTWEDLLAAHEKWLLDFNYQHHFAHEQREDGCHSPAAVLGWVKGMQPEPERIYRAFSAVGEMRSLTLSHIRSFATTSALVSELHMRIDLTGGKDSCLEICYFIAAW